MAKMTETRQQTIDDMLSAGWVLLEYDLMTLLCVGRDHAGNRYEVSAAAMMDSQYPVIVTVFGRVFYRIKPKDLMHLGATMIRRRNISENRQ